jgi:hypothetical protein
MAASTKDLKPDIVLKLSDAQLAHIFAGGGIWFQQPNGFPVVIVV